MRLSSCFGSFAKGDKVSSKANESGVSATTSDPAQCPFCNIPPAGQPSSFNVVLESDDFIAFHDRSPRAKVHLLTVPRRHVGTVQDLKGKEGAALVSSMQRFGARALDKVATEGRHAVSPSSGGLQPPAPTHLTSTTTSERTAVNGGDDDDGGASGSPADPQSRRRYGFHIPPFNSIDHLHMHCLVEPLTFMGRLKYPISGPHPRSRPPLIKGYSWFVSSQQAVDLLRANRRIRVGAQSAYSVVGGGWGAREFGGVQNARGGGSGGGNNAHYQSRRVYGTVDT